MSPRDYNLGKRAASVAETRRSIVEAAADLMLDQGFDVSNRAIARRADVADGTVRNHFPEREGLIEAAVREVMLERLSVPDRHLLDGLDTLRARVERLVAAFHRLYADTADFYLLHRQAREEYPVLGELEAEVGETTQRLVGVALGEHATDPRAFMMLATLIHPQAATAFAEVGQGPELAGERVADMLAAWLEG